MGNKQAKAAAAAEAASKNETPSKVPPTEEPKAVVDVAPTPQDSPSVPAYDPEKEKAPQGGTLTEETRQLDTPLAAQSQKEEPLEQETEETTPTESEPEAAAETEGEATGKVVMPPLALEKLPESGGPQPEEEDDPDLMKPPPFLMDAMSSLKGTEDTTAAEGAAKRTSTVGSTDELLLAIPITHDEVTLLEPTPVSEPEEVIPEKDDVSIDDAVSAADTDQPSKSEAASDAILFSANLGGVPEDTISLASSVARGEDELLKNIMGTSVAYPAVTSNESVRGSVAVSEMTFDETHWEFSRPSEDIDQPAPEEEPLLLGVTLGVGNDDKVALELHYEGKEAPEWEHEAAHAVPEMMDSIVANVIEQDTPEPPPPDEAQGVSELEAVPLASSVYEATAMERAAKEEPIVSELTSGEISVVMVALKDEVKLSLVPKSPHLVTAESEVSDKQFSVKLETPFEDLSESQDLGASLDDVPEGGADEKLDMSLSGESKTKPRKSRSRKKKGRSKSNQPSVSDGSASVESSGKEATEKPPSAESSRSEATA